MIPLIGNTAAILTDSAVDGPFARAALELREFGLVPLPLGGEDGKVPLVSGFTTWARPPAERTILSWIPKWSKGNVGIVTGLSGVTVIDIDDPAITESMIERFGKTPLMTSTPSGGVHLWYRADNERSRTRIDGLKVDIKASGGMVVVPPSIRPTGPYAGKEYGFLAGGWEDLRNIPKIKAGGLGVSSDNGNVVGTKIGQRNESLFRFLLREVRRCDSQDDLMDVAMSWNDNQPEEPLPANQVAGTVRSAWKIQSDNRNLVGGAGECRISAPLMERVISHSPKHGANAVCLYLKLKKEHWARDERGEPFPVVPKAMSEQGVLPWTEYQFRHALRVLRSYPLLDIVKRGGSGKGDAHLYRFRPTPSA